ncbi:hypothetical protein N7492_007174 [Penicillium capsulatum]|uniref:SHSP domain-containing protein n=1 Tax=Penicillium capsulatum TaxID=69766 RepID=A0A9W9HZC5_9EURO|nr:hypothetical protein N7492_007174 [Penicillium capsulatum]KAJ6117012.1 hypothetical protein N7512_006737 [Penicillium capsulatum]
MMASFYDMDDSFWANLSASLKEEDPFSAFARHNHRHSHDRPAPFWGWGGPAHPGRQHQPPHPFFWGWGHPAEREGAKTPQPPRGPGQDREATPGPSSEHPKNTEQEATPSSETEPEYHRGKGKRPTRDQDGTEKASCDKERHGPHHSRGFYNGGPAGAGPYRFPFGGCDARQNQRGHGSQRAPRGPEPFEPNIDFLRNVARQFGVHFETPTPEGVDFVPAVDVFDAADRYIVHVSLPGAKKDDLSIDYDADESVLRLAGVVYRPDINEDLHQTLAMEGRAREVGVFEREVRFGTRQTPAVVAVDEIIAKLEDGVLIVTLPKVIPEPRPKKKVFVQQDGVQDAAEEKASVTMTPDGSESDGEETKEYVKVPVQ